jgi:L-ribulose-5-phosphate 3-epimerase UlaE
MDLNKNNRASLLEELNKAKEGLDLEQSINKNNTDQERLDWSDMRIFLLQQRISLIEKSLINNEIDF